MQIDLKRTFSVAGDELKDSDDWAHYFDQGSDKLTWNDLHEKQVTVVVGEAGIGKTIEFKNEVKRLQEAGKAAFFIELNQLRDRDNWELALGQSAPAYTLWEQSPEDGYFFLDAVDEARLNSHAAFKTALMIVQAGLSEHLGHVRIAISSRWTDWSIEEVRTTVEEFLVAPIGEARRAARVIPEGELGAEAQTIQFEQPSSEEQPEPFVVSLDPLSRPEAQKFADALGVVEAPTFWAAIDDGHYDYMATRPLDLQWMVGLWNQKRCLGTYLDLINGNVANRLTETNPSYQTSGTVPSQDQLLKGAEELAAACEFSGRASVATGSASTSRSDEVLPQVVLAEWVPMDISRLLASAIFDEATFGRVKFHHRSVREYLAARWVDRQLATGLPLHRLLPLFAASPFGEQVLFSARRSTLCWLAAINVKVREWVTRHFPEMLLFEGDPEAWDALSADQAFLGYVQRLKDGLRTDWYNNASEFRRVGRRLPSDRVAALLADSQLPARVKMSLLPIVKHARLTDCADVVFGVYKSPTASSQERLYALDVLETIATPEQREIIKSDLLSGTLDSNGLIASALAAVDWKNLTVGELVQMFTTAGSEGSFGPMARAIKEDLLPTATADSAALLLEAIVAVLPRAENGKLFAKYPESNQPERAWLLDVLPDCFERLLTLLPTTLEVYSAVFFEAAEHIETLRHTGFTDHQEMHRLHGLLAKHPRLRWQLGLVIAQSENITHSTSRLIRGNECIVSFRAADMPELLARANDTGAPPDERALWFAIAKGIAFQSLRGPARKAALTTLEAGPEGEVRAQAIADQCARFIRDAQHQRQWKAEERRRRHEHLAQHGANRAKLRADIQHIRDATDRGTLNWLVQYSYGHSGRVSLTRVDYRVIAKAFGQDIADALAVGLKAVWMNAGTPNPADYQDGSLPWEALTGLAGLHTLLAENLDVATLTEEEAARAARLAVWELNGPPSWFERLATTQSSAVCEALHPWICSEALSETDAHRNRGALEMALRCSLVVRSMLLRPLVAMVTDGRVTRSETVRAVVDALREDGIIPVSTTVYLCRTRLIVSISTEGLIGEIHWLHTWLEEDTHSAWTWFAAHIAGLGATAGKQVKGFAEAMGECKWVKTPANDATIETLLQLYALLRTHLPPPGSPVEDEDQSGFWHPITRLREAIPGVLVQARGAAAHWALAKLAAAETELNVKSWLGARVYEHAALEASQSAHFEPSDMRTMGSPFLTEPRSAAQLFQQVVARLEEIRMGIEEGPFSDRDLFSNGMLEKKLQVWLAARFLDTQSRRFSVHREEVVDADKRTDIQLSDAHGNVCVEIKPFDTERGYSANSLTETLRTQIVDQYLKGYNSSHGILVLFRLDKKTWDIPGGARGQPFSALVTHLQEQACLIKAESPGIQELIVFAIDCMVPKTP